MSCFHVHLVLRNPTWVVWLVACDRHRSDGGVHEHDVVLAGMADGGEAVLNETGKSVPMLQTIRCLHAAADGRVWIGYGGSSVGRWQAGRFAQIRAEQGFSDDYISQILEDGEVRPWFAGNRALFCVR